MIRLFILFLSIFCIFILGCNHKILNPNIDNSNNKSKTMYFKFKVSGKLSLNKFKYGNEFFRNNFSCTIPLKDYDESKNNNTALISIVLYPDNNTYKFTFDGFESK
ncbi:hypothetical protein OFR22_04420 [Brachyspira hyodysenteriae]|uniref:Lipoprotein n=2 Tax=Brachyspira hyodysenteriae TaxID=159 RepID=A0A3B6VH68_BRAHW|nr:hypothetical protein [Brachyspira hyodysenteriae]ACN84564.1 hypothetical protein BHWA1_02106 [Brachyspira hyodysenteriae WA1]ANN63361.1 hypothetical protein BHYOB78_05630 [Brachyspira hyodysenteriae ATCC 27164]AUJ50296.1 hypothetical protein BH718_01863 [Brachyspira hyodysenteriae]KLI13823.1 hypothetical protein SU45_11540 [Brachyspira hyodysenteriae]KLI14505.1 hypothetical protein SU44_10420 [Brachyspira hyodysenteriae]